MSAKNPWSKKDVSDEATAVQMDSSAAKALALNKRVSARNEHIDLKYHFVKATLVREMIYLVDVKSENNPAAILTKLLELPTILLLSQSIRLIRD